MSPPTLLAPLGSVARYARRFWQIHRVWSIVIILIVLFGGYRAYAAATAAPTETRYVTATVATGTVVASLTETGQVSASQQLTLSPKASGQVVGVYVKPGDKAYAGEIIAELDATDALQSLASAKLSLQNAELTYQETTATSTLSLNLLQAKNAVTGGQIALQKAHDSAYTSLASVYTDLSAILTHLDSDLHDSTIAGRAAQQNLAAFTDIVSPHDQSISIFNNSAQTSYDAAVSAYDTAVLAYKKVTLTASDADLESLADTTYTAARTAAEAVKDSHDFFDRVSTDYTLYNLPDSSALDTLLSSVNTDATTITNDAAAALTAKSNLISAEQSLVEAQNALATLQGSGSTLTLQQAALALAEAQNAVTNAEEAVANYQVRAPFSGTIASVGVKKYDQASSGTAVATLVTSTQEVDLSVNEVDASKIKTGQKATVTFDALPDITIAGTVASVNSIGTVSQGVVSYDVIIGLDTANLSVKPGMSASADIVIGTESGLVVPSSAVKTIARRSVVQVFNPPLTGSAGPEGAPSPKAPVSMPVVAGLSDDTKTVIERGLSAGDQVVASTITGAAVSKSAAAQSTSLFGGAAAGGARGGATAGSARTLTR